MTIQELMLGRGGSYTIQSGALVILDTLTDFPNGFVLMVANEDTIFTALEDEIGRDMLVDDNMAGVTFPSGWVKSPIKGRKLGSIHLTSGSVEIYPDQK